MNKNNLTLKISVLLGYVAMVAVNFLANVLPIGGVTTGEASDSFGNLFTPAGATFSIWGLIYLLLLGYTLYQFGFGNKQTKASRDKLFATINRYFLITSIANIAWIFAWHYGVIWLSVVIMFTLLFLLIKIADVINKEKYNILETVLVRLPFSVYFGWITIATIANITVFLVSINWNGFGIAEYIWTVIVLLVGAAIGTIRMLKDKNIFYGIVLVWAYGGIWLKHTSASGFDGAYANVITTVIICIIIFLSAIGFLGYKKAISRKLDN
ncbi:tryptophan-rich sensory protein [Patescibacteria group bacterium]|nr:tryptophan-rich sensory protein [Patescibacteria group bacterium]